MTIGDKTYMNKFNLTILMLAMGFSGPAVAAGPGGAAAGAIKQAAAGNPNEGQCRSENSSETQMRPGGVCEQIKNALENVSCIKQKFEEVKNLRPKDAHEWCSNWDSVAHNQNHLEGFLQNRIAQL